jgi:type III pantothenate kinase
VKVLLTIDVGNTQTVIGAWDDSRLRRTWRLPTRPDSTADEFRAALHGLLALEGLAVTSLKGVAVSSVVPRMTALLKDAFAALGHEHLRARIIGHDWPFSFRNAAEPPTCVGMDRLVNAEAAVREHGAGPIIIVDSGTATTLCAVTDRTYLGGAILPGMELGMDALARRAALLYSVDLAPPAQAIGRNTPEALRSGLVLGYASMIDGMVRRFKDELGEPKAKVVATGGVSRLLQGLAQELEFFDPDLTLRGIRHLYESVYRH